MYDVISLLTSLLFTTSISESHSCYLRRETNSTMNNFTSCQTMRSVSTGNWWLLRNTWMKLLLTFMQEIENKKLVKEIMSVGNQCGDRPPQIQASIFVRLHNHENERHTRDIPFYSLSLFATQPIRSFDENKDAFTWLPIACCSVS